VINITSKFNFISNTPFHSRRHVLKASVVGAVHWNSFTIIKDTLTAENETHVYNRSLITKIWEIIYYVTVYILWNTLYKRTYQNLEALMLK